MNIQSIRNGPGAVALTDLGDHVVDCASERKNRNQSTQSLPLYAPSLDFVLISDFYWFVLTANQSENGQMEKMHKFVDPMLLIYRIYIICEVFSSSFFTLH